MRPDWLAVVGLLLGAVQQSQYFTQPRRYEPPPAEPVIVDCPKAECPAITCPAPVCPAVTLCPAPEVCPECPPQVAEGVPDLGAWSTAVALGASGQVGGVLAVTLLRRVYQAVVGYARPANQAGYIGRVPRRSGGVLA